MVLGCDVGFRIIAINLNSHIVLYMNISICIYPCESLFIWAVTGSFFICSLYFCRLFRVVYVFLVLFVLHLYSCTDLKKSGKRSRAKEKDQWR
jgi:hypothetical protein